MNLKSIIILGIGGLLSACGGGGDQVLEALEIKSENGGTNTVTTDNNTAASNNSGIQNNNGQVNTGNLSTIQAATVTTGFEIAVVGDMPYRELTGGWARVIDEINAANVDFVVHTGDLKGRNAPCSNEYFQEMSTQFQKFQHPLVYTPGETDWATCTRDDNGRYYPEERLITLRSMFAGKTSMGNTGISLTRQSDVMVGFEAYPENTMWSHKGITFATAHISGNNDNAVAEENDPELQQNIQRPVEKAARQAAVASWLDYVFAQARSSGSPGLMLFIHASFPEWDYLRNYRPSYSDNSSNDQTQFAPVYNKLVALARSFNRPVTVVHGDSHYFRFDKPLSGGTANAPYFSRVETAGGDDVHWTRIKVEVSNVSKDIFFAMPETVMLNDRVIPDNKPVRTCGSCVGNQAFDVALMGNTPHNEPLSSWNNLRTDIQQGSVRFAVHVGDFKPQWSACDDAFYTYMSNEFNKFTVPLFYTPGDNDWTDCAGVTPAYQPLERLARLREVFTRHGNISFGQPPYIFTQAQSELFGYRKYAENRMWYNDPNNQRVLFATVHVVGSNNNQDGTAINNEEYLERTNTDKAWLEMVFQEAKRTNVAGVMLFMNGDPNWPLNNDEIGGGLANAYSPIVRTLRNETITFGKPVAVVHAAEIDNERIAAPYGRGFDFIVDKPLKDETNTYTLQNLTRVHVFGDRETHWVRARIDPDHPDVFMFRPELVENNLDNYLVPQ